MFSWGRKTSASLDHSEQFDAKALSWEITPITQITLLEENSDHSAGGSIPSEYLVTWIPGTWIPEYLDP